VVGTAHSWSSIAQPRSYGATISLQKLSGITKLLDPNEVEQNSKGEVQVLAGTSFADLHHELNKKGLAVSWMVSITPTPPLLLLLFILLPPPLLIFFSLLLLLRLSMLSHYFPFHVEMSVN